MFVMFVYVISYICTVCSFRILPHKQDTGGFFVAVMEKKCLLKDVTQPPTSESKTSNIDLTVDTVKSGTVLTADEKSETETGIKRKLNELQPDG